MFPINDTQNIKTREIKEREREELQEWFEKVWGVELESSAPVETEDKGDNPSR